ncbi:hypothetical protein QEN19_001756 [Hanseniaspora menglaensis]
MNNQILVKTIDLKNEKHVLSKLLPPTFANQEYLILYETFLFEYFNINFLQQDEKYVEVTVYLILKYLKFSIALHKTYKNELNKPKRQEYKEKLRYIHTRYLKRFKAFFPQTSKTGAVYHPNFAFSFNSYIFIGNKPLRNVSITGTITGHDFIDLETMNKVESIKNIKFFLDDCSVPLNSEFDDEILCLIPCFKTEINISHLIGQRVQVRGKLQIKEHENAVIIIVDDFCWIKDIFQEVINHKISKINDTFLETYEWILPSNTAFQTDNNKFVKRRCQWEQYRVKYTELLLYGKSSISKRYDLTNLFIKLNKPPELRIVTTKEKDIMRATENLIFLEILRQCYELIEKDNKVINFLYEFNNNSRIANIMVGAIGKLKNTIGDAVFLYFDDMKILLVRTFFTAFNQKKYILSQELIEYCEQIYINIKNKLYDSNETLVIECCTDVFIDNKEFVYVIVKHVCYNYLQIKFSSDISNNTYNRLNLTNIGIDIDKKVKIMIYLRSHQ